MSEKTSVPVWDLAVRIFHWSLVICFSVAYFTAEQANPWHLYAGYAVLALVGFRTVWGFIGSRHARFSDFVFSPTTVIDYLKSLLKRNPGHYRGHNPLGGWMVVLMLCTLLVITISGLQVEEAEEQGQTQAAASLISDGETEDAGNDAEEFWEEIHEGATNFMLFLIVLHLLGIKVSSRLHGENLLKAMFTGRKDSE